MSDKYENLKASHRALLEAMGRIEKIVAGAFADNCSCTQDMGGCDCITEIQEDVTGAIEGELRDLLNGLNEVKA